MGASSIRLAHRNDAKAIADIYNYYILNTSVTFEEQPITADEMALRMESKIEQNRWFVNVDEGRVTGYAYAGPFASRSAWRYTLELSVYIDNNCAGKGVGTKLYQHLLRILKEQDVHSVMGLITLPNESSVRLHEKLGFTKVGLVGQGGYKFGRWIDVEYWQLML